MLGQETKPFRADSEIVVMTQLVGAYQSNDVDQFEQVLRANQHVVMDDPFIREHIEELLRNVRTEVSLSLFL